MLCFCCVLCLCRADAVFVTAAVATVFAIGVLLLRADLVERFPSLSECTGHVHLDLQHSQRTMTSTIHTGMRRSSARSVTTFPKCVCWLWFQRWGTSWLCTQPNGIPPYCGIVILSPLWSSEPIGLFTGHHGLSPSLLSGDRCRAQR